MSRWARLFVLACCAVAGAFYVATHFRGWMYRGGHLVDHGLLGRPRYVAQFDPIALDRTGTYVYTFSRFPAADALVELATPGASSVESIERLTTTIRFLVVDGRGGIQCDGSGSPAGRPDDHRLVVTSSAAVDSLWHIRCARLDLRSCVDCRLEITIATVDPSTPAIAVIPTIAGGGIELP